MIKSDKLTIGITAPVDAGKTTLSECLLFNSGSIRKIGRVDHKNAFLDNYELEKQRGITIFSKQAEFALGNKKFTLLDTPGHIDFSAEMERTLQVLDYAILIVSAPDGVTAYTRTLWNLLSQYRVPVFIFVNKMDQSGADRNRVYDNIRKMLSSECIDLESCDEEELVVCDEKLLEKHLEGGHVTDEDIRKLISWRRIFPVYFGSALKNDNIQALSDALENLTLLRAYPDEFGARVFKISRDASGNRLTHMKITGGSLSAKEMLADTGEKIDRIRIMNGLRFTEPKEVKAGDVCACLGISSTFCGQSLGCDTSRFIPEMTPVLSYRVILPEGADVHDMLMKLRQIQEEEPQLAIEWDEEHSVINARLMGIVQTEVLRTVFKDRFGQDIDFGEGNIVYMETVKGVSEGVGHYEPLRHYSEVHLLLEPLERGAGLVFESAADNDVLKPHWQSLILSHLEEKTHRGVLTGSPITDMKITVISGRDHVKHTEPGDFRQATYRAVRHGLMRNNPVLLEPYYDFTLTVPSSQAGRAMSDIQRMYGTFDAPVTEGEYTVITGRGPVSEMNGYHAEVISYTRGEGRFFARSGGYEECHNQEEVVEKTGYSPDRDTDNPSGSIFCSHGAGYYVPWNEVEEHMHIGLLENFSAQESSVKGGSLRPASDDELKAIFEKTYGKSEKRVRAYRGKTVVDYDDSAYKSLPRQKKKTGPPYLIVDGYNVLFSREEKVDDIEIARLGLIEELKDYSTVTDDKIVLVFDGYKVRGNTGTVTFDGIEIVYTKENETADSYIEKIATELSKTSEVTVATSDYMEQLVVFGSGARRITSNELIYMMEESKEKVRSTLAEYKAEIKRDRRLKDAFDKVVKEKKDDKS